jgi:hypothetical protein
MCATLIILQLTEENVVRVLVNGGRDRFAHGAGSRNRSISTKNQGESEKEKRRNKKLSSEQEVHLSGHRFRLDV